jgi:thiamine pyrophosphate-dependent acetolactate synthase large subunit-like protein
MNASKFLLQRLNGWGVTRIFGYPGDGINGICAALEEVKDKIDFIQVRHEEMAAFMACAHAKFTGEVGVCMATSGPGAIHLMNGLYDAKMDHVPVVAIVGQAATMALGGSYQQEVDLQTLFKDVSEYNYTITNTMATRHIVDRAMRVAMGMRGVSTIIFPKDLQEESYEEPPRTVYKYWKRWSNPQLIFFISNNSDLNQVSWEQRIMTGAPRNMETQPLPDFPYAKFGESLGFKGIRVNKPDQVERAWDEALSADRPVVFEAVVDPNVATLPPHITREQAIHFLKAIRKGDPDERGIIGESVKQMIAGVIPHRAESHARKGE